MLALWLTLCLATPADAGELDLDLRFEDFDRTEAVAQRIETVLARTLDLLDERLGFRFGRRTELDLFLIADRATYEARFRAEFRDPERLGYVPDGYFAAAHGGVVWRHPDTERFFRVLVHEATHHLVSRGGGGIPTWMNEGLASVFGEFRVEGNAVWLDPVPKHVKALRTRGIPSVATLLTHREPRWAWHRERTARAVYAYGWALCAFLLSTDQGTATLRAIAQAKPGNDGDAVLAIVERTYRGGAATLDRDVRAWIERGAKPLQLPVSHAGGDVTPSGKDPCPGGILMRKGTEEICVR